jgi:uncharacterized protein YjbI with pentapeptide repeats
VRWLLQERGWSAPSDTGTDQRPDFRAADFRDASLQGLDLRGANLNGALLTGADLHAAKLDEADLGDEVAGRARAQSAIYLRFAAVSAQITVYSFVVWGGLRLSGLVSANNPVVFGIEFVSLFATAVALFFLAIAGQSEVFLPSYQPERSVQGKGSLRIAIYDVVSSVEYFSPFGRRRRPRQARKGPDLTEASLRQANLRYAMLENSSLRGADLKDADLANAALTGANLTGASLDGTNLGSAVLAQAQIDSVKVLHGAILDSQTKLYDVLWRETPLTRPATGKRRIDRITAALDRSRVYRTVGIALRQEGLYAQASSYRLQELRTERYASRLEARLGRWLVSKLLDLVAGYGELPGRILFTYLVVVLGFAVGYYGAAQHFDFTHLEPTHAIDALVFSLTSFHGRGFFPGTMVTPHDLPVVLAALEAVIGLFIELTLIATLSKRFLGN